MSRNGSFCLSVTSHINWSVACCLINVCLSHGMCLYQVMMMLHFLNDVANDAESTKYRSLHHIRYFEE